MPRRDVAIEILAPTQGIHKEQSASVIDLRQTPNALAAISYYGAVQKDYGTTLFNTGTAPAAVPMSFLYEANFGANTTLQGFSHTAMHIYSSALGYFVNDSTAYTVEASSFRLWNVCMHNNQMIYTNFADTLQGKLAYNAAGTSLVSAITSGFKAYAVVSFANHLNMYHTEEGGSECRKRCRWTMSGLLNNNGADWTAGTAGFVDMQDADGDVMTAAQLGNGGVAIYAENSVHLQEWVGGADVYRFTKMINGRGTPSRRGLAVNDTIHYVLCRDGIYEYTGGTTMKEISLPIRPDFVEIVNQNYIQNAFLQYIKDDNELRVYVPTGTATLPNTCYIYRIPDDAWYKKPTDYVSEGTFSRQSNLTIGQMTNPIGSYTWKFGDKANVAGSTVYILGDQTGRVVKLDKSVFSLSSSGTSAAQSLVFDTKDLSSVGDVDPLTKSRYNASEYMDNQTRWQEVKIEAKGYGSMDAQYSVDGGTSWVSFPEGSKTLTGQWKMYTYDVDITAERFMVRILNSALNEVVSIRYIKARFVPGSEI